MNIGNRLRHILRFPRTLYASTLPAYAGVTLIIWWAFASLTEAGLAEAIYFVTGAIVLWYTVETHAMRREVTRQITLQIRPFLAIEYGEDGKMWIYNIGKGVARDIRYHTVPLAEANPGDTILTVQWKPTDFLPEGQRREMIGEGAFVEGEDRAKFSERMAVWLANFGPHGRARYEFLVDYSDLTGTQYRAAFKVDSGHTQLLRDAELKGETRPAERSRTVSEDTLRSTFTSVAHALAAVLAILIAIVVIRLPAIEGAVDTAHSTLRMSYGDEKFVEAKKAFEKGGIAGLESSGFRVEKEELNIRPRLRNGYRAWTTWGNLIPAARIALILTFANIAICLVLVPAVPRLVSHQKTARSLTVAVVVLALVCLGTYIVLALRLLGSRPL